MMLFDKNVEHAIATVGVSDSSRATVAVLLHIRIGGFRVSRNMYPQLKDPFYTFYTSLGNSKLDHVETAKKATYARSVRRSVESVDTQLDGRVTGCQARDGKCRQ